MFETNPRYPIISAVAYSLAICFLSLLCLFMSSSCNNKTISFKPFNKVTKVEVVDNMNNSIKIIKDHHQINQIIIFINSYSSGWGGSGEWAGVPAPKISVNIYNDEELTGSFGIAEDSFVTQRENDFKSRSISDVERKKFLDLIGISEQ